MGKTIRRTATAKRTAKIKKMKHENRESAKEERREHKMRKEGPND